MATLMNAPAPPEGGQTFPRLSEQIGNILVFAPTESKTLTTKQGESPVVVGPVMVFNEKTKKVEELGTVTVFWAKVRAQLMPAIETRSYVVGRLKMSGHSYVLDPVDDATLKAIQVDF